ncbi:sensor histidine kinase [Georgenia yuyongxinii]|uniref:histidine kinase n=1 Tax=Georgenia yuyongxinii TaxID=2589797 RepID=A0A5B8C272_9MICO|nr:sensor histidine kinase [Georgenia yuyongxinii]QDC24693.1 sensor histidine kinase [Georgenia yuyongxinii]
MVAPPVPADAVLALVFTVIAQVDVWRPDLAVWGDDPVAGPAALNSALLLLVTVPVAWRRTAPLAATAASMTGVTAQAALTGQPPIGLLLVAPVLTVVYSAAAYGTRRQAWIGLALTAVATAVHDALDPRIQSLDDVGEASYWWLVIALAWLVGLYVGSRRRARLDAALARQREVELERAEQEAVARERLRIANELHDVVAHNVSVVALHVGAALELLDGTSERAREPLLIVEATARSTLKEMRSLLGILRSADADATQAPQPGLASLRALVAGVTDAGLPVELAIEGKAHPLPAGVDLAAYRIVQEALTNILKHAVDATHAVVRVCFAPGRVQLSIFDDGRPNPRADRVPGHGLVGMRERVALYGGELTVGAGTAGGFLVEARLPIGEATP